MIYKVRINRRLRNVQVYATLKKTSGNINFLTKLVMRIFVRKKKEEF